MQSDSTTTDTDQFAKLSQQKKVLSTKQKFVTDFPLIFDQIVKPDKRMNTMLKRTFNDFDIDGDKY